MKNEADKKNKVILTTEQKIKKKIMDLLARRDHSEKEIRTKLREKFEDVEAIEKAISFIKDRNWLGDPQKLAEQMSNMLHRRNKGARYIQNYLKEKGLPSIPIDSQIELEKAKELIKKKFKTDDRSRSTLMKKSRFLQSRGFNNDVISKIIFNKGDKNED